jgi:crossover junction endodeoxyribonuclease RuvC
MAKERIILGIDPGSIVLGYALIAANASSYRLIQMGVFQIGKAGDHFERLREVFSEITNLIREYEVSEMAIEAPFFGKNVQSMLKLGRVQGVCIAAAMGLHVSVEEYAPRFVKQSITGRGAASKTQVWAMLENLVTGLDKDLPLDASDALSVALCHYFKTNRRAVADLPAPKTKSAKTKKGSWSDFIAQNPHRKSGG